MTVGFVSPDLEWTDEWKACVEAEIVAPLKRFMKSDRFEMSFNLEKPRKSSDGSEYEMWAVLQSFDGHNNEIVRRRGSRFSELVHDVSSSLSSQVRKSRGA